MLHVQLDGLVAQLLDEIGPPVPLQAGRIERVEDRLQGRMGHRADMIEDGFPELPYRLESLFRFADGRGAAPHDAAGLRPAAGAMS